MISREVQGDVAVVQMQHGKVNALDIEFFRVLVAEFDELERMPVRSVVLCGSGNVYSAGVDLFRILNSGQDYIREFVPILASGLERLFLFSKPLVAAVNGHAIAGGCIFACACDARLMADGTGRIGVPELLVGVPFPSVAMEIMRFVAPPQFFQEIVYSAGTYLPAEALRRGLIDEVVPADSLLNRAIEVAQKYGALPAQAFALTKTRIRQPAMDRARLYPDLEEKIVKVWQAPETHSMIRNYLEKTLKPRT